MKSIEDRVADMILAGKTQPQITAALGVDRKLPYRVAGKRGLKLTKCGRVKYALLERNLEQIRKMLADGKTHRQITEKLHCSITHLRDFLKQNGLTSKQGRRDESVSEEYLEETANMFHARYTRQVLSAWNRA